MWEVDGFDVGGYTQVGKTEGGSAGCKREDTYERTLMSAAGEACEGCDEYTESRCAEVGAMICVEVGPGGNIANMVESMV